MLPARELIWLSRDGCCLWTERSDWLALVRAWACGWTLALAALPWRFCEASCFCWARSVWLALERVCD